MGAFENSEQIQNYDEENNNNHPLGRTQQDL